MREENPLPLLALLVLLTATGDSGAPRSPDPHLFCICAGVTPPPAPCRSMRTAFQEESCAGLRANSAVCTIWHKQSDRRVGIKDEKQWWQQDKRRSFNAAQR